VSFVCYPCSLNILLVLISFLSNADDFRASAEAAVANSVPPGEHPADLHFVSSKLSDLPPPTSQSVMVTSASTQLPSSVSSQRPTTPVLLSSATAVNVSEPVSPSTEQKVRVALARDSFRQSSERTRHSHELSRPTPLVPTTPTENHSQLLLETDALLAKYASPQLTQEQKSSLRVQSAHDLQYSSLQLAKSSTESGKPQDATSSSILGSNSNLSRFWNDLSAFKPVPRSSEPKQPSPKPFGTTPVSTSQLTQMLIGRIFGSIPNVSGVVATTSTTVSTTSLTPPFSERPAPDRTSKNNENFMRIQTGLNGRSTSVSGDKAPVPSVVGHKESIQAVPSCTADKFDTYVTTSWDNRFMPITDDLKTSKIVIEAPVIPLPSSEDKVTVVSSTTRDVTDYVEPPVEVPQSDFRVKERDTVPPKPSLLTSTSLDDNYGFNKLPPFSAEEHLRQLRIRAGLESSPQLGLQSESTTHVPSMHLSSSSNVLSVKPSVPKDQPVNVKSTPPSGFGFIDFAGVQSRATNLMPKFSSDKPKSTSISTPSIPDLFASIKTGFDSGLGSVNRKAHQSQQQPQQQRQAASSGGFSFGPKSSATGLLGNLLSSAASKAHTVAAGAIKHANAAADAAKEAATQAVGQLTTAQATAPSSGSRTLSTSHGSLPHSSPPPAPAHTLVPPRLPSELCLAEHQPLRKQPEPSYPSVRLHLDDHELSPTLNGRPIPVGQEEPEHPSAVTIRRDSSERRQSLFVPQERRWLHEQTMDMTTDDDYDDDAYERRETTPEVGDHYDPSQEEFTAGSDAEPISFICPTGISNTERKPTKLDEISDGSLDSDAVSALQARDKMLMATATAPFFDQEPLESDNSVMHPVRRSSFHPSYGSDVDHNTSKAECIERTRSHDEGKDSFIDSLHCLITFILSSSRFIRRVSRHNNKPLRKSSSVHLEEPDESSIDDRRHLLVKGRFLTETDHESSLSGDEWSRFAASPEEFQSDAHKEHHKPPSAISTVVTDQESNQNVPESMQQVAEQWPVKSVARQRWHDTFNRVCSRLGTDSSLLSTDL
ncbi:hypothetical protein AHF37_01312, partial [Paragonimus kellicotti]